MPRLKEFENTLAIAMWDFTYLEKHVKGGVFEDFDKVCRELVERGYNAVRIDAYPHLVARDAAGQHRDTFVYKVGNGGAHHFGFSLWGREWTIEVNPRKTLVEMIRTCEKYGIWIGLSAWLGEVEELRADQIQGPGALARIWDETLNFLKDENCLSNIIYVDLVNEYPLWNGFNWMHRALDNLKYPKADGQEFNESQQEFYWSTINQVICTLQAKWPQFDFLACQTDNHWTFVDKDKDYSAFGVLDVHVWMVHHADFGRDSKNFEYFHSFNDDSMWRIQYPKMLQLWHQSKEDLTVWMEGRIKSIAETAAKWKIACGNTEGWGQIFWCDHPYLDWTIVREAGEICSVLAAKHGFAFACTSNFTHPNFSLWNDVEWHKKLTGIIKSGRNASFQKPVR